MFTATQSLSPGLDAVDKRTVVSWLVSAPEHGGSLFGLS